METAPPIPTQPQAQYIPIMQPAPVVPLGTLPSTAAFQEMLELLRVSRMAPNLNIQSHPEQENQVRQRATTDQQQELVRYLTDLNQWLSRDVNQRRDEIRDVENNLDALRDFIDHGLPQCKSYACLLVLAPHIICSPTTNLPIRWAGCIASKRYHSTFRNTNALRAPTAVQSSSFWLTNRNILSSYSPDPVIFIWVIRPASRAPNHVPTAARNPASCADVSGATKHHHYAPPVDERPCTNAWTATHVHSWPFCKPISPSAEVKKPDIWHHSSTSFSSYTPCLPP